MSKLIVSATKFEVAPVLEQLEMQSLFENETGPCWKRGPDDVDVLITGVGQMQSAYHLGSLLGREHYSLALNFGIAGSFREQYPSRTVVRVIQEELADLGAEGDNGHIDLFEMGLLDRNFFPFKDGALRAPELELNSISDLPRVGSITVNRVLDRTESIRLATEKFDPDVVNMEGGAFFYSCASANIPCASVRAISDRVGPRDKSKWDIPGAVKALAAKAIEIIEELRTRT